MKKFILLITFLFLINISIISNQAFAEESNQSGQQISDSNLNESNISNIDIDKYENEDLNTNLETDNNTNEDVENEEPNISTSAIAVESENNNDVENNENNENNSEIQNTQPENNSIEKANVEIENSESTSSENISSGEEKFNDEKSSLSLEKIDVNQGKNEAINNVAESIIGQDDRKIVRDLIKAPNKSIVHISSYVNDSILYGGGTGFLIDNYTVLTAAHVITSDYIDYPINKIIIEAGYKDEKATFGTANVIKTYVMPEWKNFRNYFFDMAILIIDKPLGKDLGKLNIIDEVTLGEFISTTGYPGSNKNNIDKIKKGNQYYSSGKIVNITKNKIYYDSDTEPGQSGSPVFNINNDVIAIHTRGFNENDSYKYNSGIRLSSTNIETINEWKNELKIEDFNKYIYINEKNAKVWKDLNFNELYKNDKDILVRVYKAENLYTDSIGGKYLLIKDKNYQFIGFININDITEINATATNLSVQLKKENIKHFRNLFEDVKTDTKLSFNSYYKVKYTYRLPNNRIIYSLYDKNDKWQGYVLNKDVNEIKFEPYDERVEIIKNNYTVWGDFFGKKNLDTKSIYHKVFNAKGIYKDKNNNRTYLKIYDSKDNYLGILNINATEKVVPQSFNKDVKIISTKYNFYHFLFDRVRNQSQNYINKKLHSKCLYKLSNGRIYYSLYDNKDKWIGYIEKEAVKVL
ncbi:trypsin-like serine protease [Mammaliicoccus sciuri]|uniref:trypsin-like serine peptidase n=1 Tax=Mammaliicoccus sciuri TaxID=1296 RepID=UPI002B2624BE|nr:trypsin-like serine protease [Mammaliicoccus sciuri]MEB7436597.1 trypsin-like serine protease [Mammaliicoccus sciuri]MEB7965161.1 trypsin-like serine protease [Mammaliicoccus sciuri]MEB8294564.1 trypsin-like serine protease [Mammaliicoccus sciuri]WQK59661.1 trypsin-like serine protease [Mammaliicoccus sciuri]